MNQEVSNIPKTSLQKPQKTVQELLNKYNKIYNECKEWLFNEYDKGQKKLNELFMERMSIGNNSERRA